MKRNQSSSARGAYGFRTTRWSVVLLAAQGQTAGFKEALAELCNLYWYPLYAFVRQRGYSPEDAQDLTQGFFAHLLEHKALTRVDRQKGRFRSFLLAALQKYLSNEAGRTGCAKRGGKAEFVSLDGAEDRYRLEPVEALTPEKVFDARWAMALLAKAMDRLNREYIDHGKTDAFEVLKAFLDPLNSKKAWSADLAFGEREVSGRRYHDAPRPLSDLPRAIRMVSWGDRLFYWSGLKPISWVSYQDVAEFCIAPILRSVQVALCSRWVVPKL